MYIFVRLAGVCVLEADWPDQRAQESPREPLTVVGWHPTG